MDRQNTVQILGPIQSAHLDGLRWAHLSSAGMGVGERPATGMSLSWTPPGVHFLSPPITYYILIRLSDIKSNEKDFTIYIYFPELQFPKLNDSIGKTG